LISFNIKLTPKEEGGLKVVEGGVVRIHLGFKCDKITGEWKKLHSGKLYDLKAASDVIKVINKRTMRWVGYIARWEKEKCKQNFGGHT
jgi:hypothetical protein